MDTMLDIWNALRERVRRFVGSRVRDPATADDITQDVMLKVQAQRHTLRAGEKLPAWVFATARNAIIDHYRTKAVREHADVQDHDAEADNDAHMQNAVRDLTLCLTRMIEQLPEPYRQAMRLADLEGSSQQEVADQAGISLSGAKSRVQRARQMMREMLDDCCRIERDCRGNVMDFDRTERSSRYCGTDSDDPPKCGA